MVDTDAADRERQRKLEALHGVPATAPPAAQDAAPVRYPQDGALSQPAANREAPTGSVATVPVVAADTAVIVPPSSYQAVGIKSLDALADFLRSRTFYVLVALVTFVALFGSERVWTGVVAIGATGAARVFGIGVGP